jgi:hypothetical protein
MVSRSGGTIRYKEISPKLNHIPDIYQLFEQLQQLAGNVPEAAPMARCSFSDFALVVADSARLLSKSKQVPVGTKQTVRAL